MYLLYECGCIADVHVPNVHIVIANEEKCVFHQVDSVILSPIRRTYGDISILSDPVHDKMLYFNWAMENEGKDYAEHIANVHKEYVKLLKIFE